MAAYIYTGTTGATARALSLWNGSSNNTPPPFWYLPGFDDSAWPVATSTGPLSAFPDQDIEGIAPWSVPPDPHASMLLRWTFRAPVSPPLRYYTHDWLISSSNNVAGTSGWVLNGTSLPSRFLLSTTEALINFGADNLLAIAIDMSPLVSGWSGAQGWFAHRFIFFEPDVGNTAYSWGTITPGVNDLGVLGVGDTLTHTTPVAVDTTFMGTDGGGVVKVASNGTTSLLLCASGNVYACGDNSQGFFGNGTTDIGAHLSPTQITALVDVADITIGGDCAISVTRYGDLRMWGPNAHGSLGTGDTTPKLVPTRTPFQANINTEGNSSLPGSPGETYLLTSNMIGAGADFSAFIAPTLGFTLTAGGNAYGQLGVGASGADRTTFQFVVPGAAIGSATFGTLVYIGLSAGDGQLLVQWHDDLFSHLVGCGRGVFGSLGFAGILNGTGPDFINATFVQLEFGGNATLQMSEVRQAGPVEFHLSTNNAAVGRGDGVPHGGIPDGTSSIVYGTTTLNERLLIRTGPEFGADLVLFSTLAYVSGGSQNAYVAGDSRAVFAGVGADGLLYTWGWGGAAQMGRGPTIADCLVPTALTGLSSVIGATVAKAIMFAISGPPIILPPLGGARSWSTMIG